MNYLVVIFFIHTTLAAFLLGIMFMKRKDLVIKYFGLGLVLDGIAFIFWSAVVLLRPEPMDLLVTIGVAFFLASLIAYLASSIQNLDAAKRETVLVTASVIAVAAFLLRHFVYPSSPYFSPEGIYHFNPHPIIQGLEMFALAFTALPAISALASKFRESIYSRLIQYGFISQVIGGIILISITDMTLLYVAGWAIGVSFLSLWTTLLFSKKAWAKIK